MRAVPQVQTVLGPAPASTLGPTLCHEHVAIRSPGVAEAWPAMGPSKSAILQRCVRLLSRAQRAGIGCILDHTTFDLGRDPLLLRVAAERSGVSIVAATGIWTTRPRFFGHKTDEQLAELFIRDAVTGFGGTNIRPGLIKVGVTSEPLDAFDRLLLRAAAITHDVTGLPVTLHTDASNRSGFEAVELLSAHGVDPARVGVGHSGDTTDVAYLLELLSHGVFLGLDRFGSATGPDDNARMQVVMELCEAGFAERLLLAHDTNCWNDRDTDQWRTQNRPNWHFEYIPNTILPSLELRGVGTETIRQLMETNPQTWLAGTSPVPRAKPETPDPNS